MTYGILNGLSELLNINIKRMHASMALTTSCSVHNIILPYSKVHLYVSVCV